MSETESEFPADVTEDDLEEARERGWTCSHNVAVALDFEWVLETQQKMGENYSDMWGAEVYGRSREAVEGKGGTNTRLLKMVESDYAKVNA